MTGRLFPPWAWMFWRWSSVRSGSRRRHSDSLRRGSEARERQQSAQPLAQGHSGWAARMLATRVSMWVWIWTSMAARGWVLAKIRRDDKGHNHYSNIDDPEEGVERFWCAPIREAEGGGPGTIGEELTGVAKSEGT